MADRVCPRAITLGLDDQHRRFHTAEDAHIGQPVGERLVAKREAAMCMELLGLRLGGPHECENRAGLQEQRMRTMVNVLAAEIPYLQRHRRIEDFSCERHGADLDTMG